MMNVSQILYSIWSIQKMWLFSKFLKQCICIDQLTLTVTELSMNLPIHNDVSICNKR